MNKKLLDQLIDLYFEYYKNNAKEIIEERDNKKNYYQSYTKEKILNMTDDELKKYIGGLWSANGRTKSQIFKNNKPEVLKQEIANLDRETVLEKAKQTGKDLKKETEKLVELAKVKGTPLVKKAAEELRIKAIDVTKEVTKRLEDAEIK